MRTLNRIKKQRRPFTEEHFYIFRSANNTYQLRDAKSHMVISTAHSLEDIKRCLYVILNRYKHYDKYLRAISSLSEQTVSPKDFERRQKEWKHSGKDYKKIVEELIDNHNTSQAEVEDHRKRIVVQITPTKPVKEEKVIPVLPNTLTKIHKKKKSRL